MKGKRTPTKASPTVAPPKRKARCNCPCHQGAGVMHVKFVPSNEPIKLDEDGRMKSYSSSGSSVMVPCPCELNIKIQELTEEYYERQN